MKLLPITIRIWSHQEITVIFVDGWHYTRMWVLTLETIIQSIKIQTVNCFLATPGNHIWNHRNAIKIRFITGFAKFTNRNYWNSRLAYLLANRCWNLQADYAGDAQAVDIDSSPTPFGQLLPSDPLLWSTICGHGCLINRSVNNKR